jgi:Pre-mRNA splicing factor
LAEESGGPARQQRVEWLYQGSAAVGSGYGTIEEQESFLLGKRKVDSLLKKNDDNLRENAKAISERNDTFNATKDIKSKVAMDPLLMIQKKELEAAEKAAEMEAKARDRRSKRDRDERRSERRFHSDRQERRRSRSPYRDSRNRRRSRSPAQRASRERHHRRSRSPKARSSTDYRQRDQTDRKKSDDDRTARLAAMQSDANTLESDRTRRLEEMARRDADEKAKEEKNREYKGSNFKAAIYKQTESVGLEARVRG